MFSKFWKKKSTKSNNSNDDVSPSTGFVLDEIALQLLKRRSDFPILASSAHQSSESDVQELIYVDNACVSLRPQVVIDSMSEYYSKYSSCAGRSNHRLSRSLDIALNVARENVATFIGAKHADEIIFTKNATEALNLVASSLHFEAGDIVLTSHKEHNSNLVPWLRLVARQQIVHNIIPPDSDDLFSVENLNRALENAKRDNKRVRLVSLVHASNLDGTSIDICEVVKCAHAHGALVLVDGCQAVGHVLLDVKSLGVDFYAFSAHKMCGPSGMGALYATRGAQKELSQFIVGGQTVTQTSYESYVAQTGASKFEAGLQDYAGILGFGAACKYLTEIGIDRIHNHVEKLNSHLTELLSEEIINGKIKLLGPREAKERGSIFSFVILGTSQTEFASLLDKTYDIAVRGGQHCVHSWFDAHKLGGSVRISLHFYNTHKEIEQIAKAIKSLMHLHMN